MSKPDLKKLESITSADIKSNFEEESRFREENEERLRDEFIEKVNQQTMSEVEKFYKKQDLPKLDWFDKRTPKFDYYELLEFAQDYAEQEIEMYKIGKTKTNKR